MVIAIAAAGGIVRHAMCRDVKYGCWITALQECGFVRMEVHPEATNRTSPRLGRVRRPNPSVLHLFVRPVWPFLMWQWLLLRSCLICSTSVNRVAETGETSNSLEFQETEWGACMLSAISIGTLHRDCAIRMCPRSCFFGDASVAVAVFFLHLLRKEFGMRNVLSCALVLVAMVAFVACAMAEDDNSCSCEGTVKILGQEVQVKSCSAGCQEGQTPCCGCGVLKSVCKCCTAGQTCEAANTLGWGTAKCKDPS